MAAGWGETEVPMDVSSRRLAFVLHRHLAEHGLLSFLTLLGAFLLNAIKRNQANGLISQYVEFLSFSHGNNHSAPQELDPGLSRTTHTHKYILLKMPHGTLAEKKRKRRFLLRCKRVS